MAGRSVREVRVNLRLSQAIDDRIEVVALAAGQAHSVIAALAIAAGLRTLENALLPPDTAIIQAMAAKMIQQVDGDVDEQMLVAVVEAAAKGSGAV